MRRIRFSNATQKPALTYSLGMVLFRVITPYTRQYRTLEILFVGIPSYGLPFTICWTCLFLHINISALFRLRSLSKRTTQNARGSRAPLNLSIKFGANPYNNGLPFVSLSLRRTDFDKTKYKKTKIAKSVLILYFL